MTASNFLASEEYQPFLEFAMSIARKAGKMIIEGQAKRFSSSAMLDTKGNSVDLVTETDQAVEEMIKKAIKETYPTHKFIGEETYAAEGKLDLTDDFTWIIDPIDGTTNFVHSHPFVGCSIGLCHLRTPVVGAILLPFLHQLFYARRDGGGHVILNVGIGKTPAMEKELEETKSLPLTGRKQPMESLKGCIISAEWGNDRKLTIPHKINTFSNLISDLSTGGKMVHALRTGGASTVLFCQVASGSLDIYFDTGPHCWDVCAGSVIVQESGGLFFGGKESFARGTDHIGDIILRRRYIAIRPVADSESESGEEIQKRVLKELYDVVDEWTNADIVQA